MSKSVRCTTIQWQVVRVESLGGSEMASGDEGEGLATGTSSDIEVISYRGHTRVGSDTSVGEEMDTLRRRNRDLEELVSAREARLVLIKSLVFRIDNVCGRIYYVHIFWCTQGYAKEEIHTILHRPRLQACDIRESISPHQD